MTPQPLPSKLQTPQVAAGPCDLGPLELRWFCIFPGEPQILLPGCITPELAYPRLADSTQQGGRQLGTEGDSASMGSEPTELTKPLLPHPSSGSCEHIPMPLVPACFTLGTAEFSPHLPLPAIFPSLLQKVLPTVTLDNLGAAEPWPGSWLEP